MSHAPHISNRKALIEAIARVAKAWREPDHGPRAAAVAETLVSPNRFTEEALAFAINQQMSLLTPDALTAWVGDLQPATSRVVGVLNAGNIPLVGLQDFLAVVLMGHRYLGTVSSKSPVLLPAFVDAVRAEEPALLASFVDVEDLWLSAEAVIATGTDETRAWVETQCAQQGIPVAACLIRGHRYAVAVIDGQETEAEREALAEDVLLHEGLGCRNVALIWSTKELSPDPYLESFAAFRSVFPPHPETPGGLKMQQAFLAALDLPHAYGEGLEFLMSKGEPAVQGPGHIRWAEYDPLDMVNRWLSAQHDKLQLIIARPALAARLNSLHPLEHPGEAQRPSLDWCPDGINTLTFLASL